jgi:hypothetical protein
VRGYAPHLFHWPVIEPYSNRHGARKERVSLRGEVHLPCVELCFIILLISHVRCSESAYLMFGIKCSVVRE